MKKLFTLLVVALLAMSMCLVTACGGNGDGTGDNGGDPSINKTELVAEVVRKNVNVQYYAEGVDASGEKTGAIIAEFPVGDVWVYYGTTASDATGFDVLPAGASYAVYTIGGETKIMVCTREGGSEVFNYYTVSQAQDEYDFIMSLHISAIIGENAQVSTASKADGVITFTYSYKGATHTMKVSESGKYVDEVTFAGTLPASYVVLKVDSEYQDFNGIRNPIIDKII